MQFLSCLGTGSFLFSVLSCLLVDFLLWCVEMMLQVEAPMLWVTMLTMAGSSAEGGGVGRADHLLNITCALKYKK